MKNSYSKYKNEKVILDGILFDSKKAANRYWKLKMLLRAGEISNLKMQVKYPLQESFKKNGKTIREITYIADFVYYDNKLNKWIIEDTKGYKTEVYRIKKKLFEYKYLDLEIKEV